MNRKFISFYAALLLGLVAVSQANAEVLLSQWAGNPVRDGDKIYTLNSFTGFAEDYRVDFEIIGETHILKTPINPTLVSPGRYLLDYTIEIDPFLSPTQVFEYVSLAYDTLDVVVTKTVADETGVILTLSVSGDGDFVSGGRKKLWIQDAFEIGADQGVFSFSNRFTQASVPEPASIVSFGGLALLMGVVMMRRRKRA